LHLSSSSDTLIHPAILGRMVQDKTKYDFRGKTVLLTGASGGLGRAFALQLASCQVGTLIVSARKQAELDAVVAECQSICAATTYHVIACDLADPASVDALAKTALDKCPRIDCLINNGGVSSRSRFVDTLLEVDQRVMQINFLAGAALAKAVVPAMIQPGAAPGTGGRILWIGSIQGLLAIPNRSSYAASKFAVQGYCEALRAELASSGISVSCVSPGYIRTNLSKSAITGDGGSHGVLDATTAQGADPNDVAATILDRVVAGSTDFTIAASLSAVAAIWMRLLCPGILQKIMLKRYEKSLLKEKED
jgi:dehydrogenase/reductase SDR family member 7B